MTERLRIDRLAARGDGVADTPAGAVYVPYTLPGETVIDDWYHVDRGYPDLPGALRALGADYFPPADAQGGWRMPKDADEALDALSKSVAASYGSSTKAGTKVTVRVPKFQPQALA